ncbi:lipoprotein lipase-like isoform X2 [Venturia canescens]|uniref:lipoprotein lipase-like isoform X2 n=1 Tax=Venturia canescens TaxID=32260 RepID=UPI001C9D6645|nr:lipoprotein lipase-like isoform X2 [Venturia canescens]
MVSNLAGCLTLCTIFFASSAVCQEGLLPIALAKSSTDNDPKSIASKIRWKVYKGASIKEAKILDVPVQDSQTLYDNIDSDKPVVFYMHGFRDSPKGENIRTIVAAYLERATDNIIVLDWSEIASENYITLAATRVRDVAKVLARSVDRLVQLGCDRKTIHLVGHSLGAQLVGFLGKFSKYSIPRITGLDPAYPGFYHLGAEHIDANSAELVDIIHTDGGVYGVASPTGTVDFFPNGGKRPQPGCSLLAVPSSDEGKRAATNREALQSKMRFKVYSGASIDSAEISDVPVREPEVLFRYIDPGKPVVLYVHGYREHPSNESVRTVVGAHLERGTDNAVVLDWSDLAFENYASLAASRVREIAKVLTASFDDLVRLGLDLEAFHLVGHSLGAQIAGFVGKFSANAIPRITGLDPAKPGFYHRGAEHIDAKSARFVDIVHTDAGVYGASTATGTVDFFANGGARPQPGCPVLGSPLSGADLCSHWRSWQYYAESVVNEGAFVAVRCGSFADLLLGKCDSNDRVLVGYATPVHARGSYYFSTNGRSPYGQSPRARSGNLVRRRGPISSRVTPVFHQR